MKKSPQTLQKLQPRRVRVIIQDLKTKDDDTKANAAMYITLNTGSILIQSTDTATGKRSSDEAKEIYALVFKAQKACYMQKPEGIELTYKAFSPAMSNQELEISLIEIGLPILKITDVELPVVNHH